MRQTATELRGHQDAREAQARSQRVEQAKQAEEATRQRIAAAQQAEVDKLKATWHESAEAASATEGAAFCVVARVAGSGGVPPVLGDVVADARSLGFAMELATLQRGTGTSNRTSVASQLITNQPEPCPVTDGTHRGLYPGRVPQFGESGSVQWLVVRW